jgi:flagellar hook-associated protein 2
MTSTSSVDIASALGIGSGINTTQLVSDLVSAARDPKQQAITTQQTTNNARISALASAKSSLKTFSDALTALLQTKDYNGQAVSNDPSIVAVSLISGGVPTGLPAQIEVKQLASGQVLQSAALTDSKATAGTGTLTIAVGSTSFDVTLTSPANTLADLAAAINGKNAGITASVVTDTSGSRLVLKGETGAAKAFTITAGPDADADLQRFTFDGTTGGMARSQEALNAKIAIDNVDMEFSTNEVTTAIPYLRIDLNKASPGTTVTVATDQPTSSMSQLVQDYVSAYNSLKTALNQSMAAPTSSSSTDAGLLSGDAGVRDMANKLAQLTNSTLSSDGTYKTLASLGVSTNRDGTLSVDTTKLEAAIAADPEGVTQMLNPTVTDANHPGLAGALKTITDYLNSDDGPLASSASTYNNLKTSLDNQLTALDDKMATYQDQLTTTFSAMQSRLTALKATQSYLTQQIALWSNSDSSK